MINRNNSLLVIACKASMVLSLSVSSSFAKAHLSEEELRWDKALRNLEFTSAVDVEAMKLMVESARTDYGRGGVLTFSKRPPREAQNSLADSPSTFKADEPIYMLATLGQPLDSSDRSITLSGKIVTIGHGEDARNGYIKDTLNSVYTVEGAGSRTLALDFLPSEGISIKYQKQVGEVAAALRMLPAGIHIVQLRLEGSDGLAVGAFYYDNSAGPGGAKALSATLNSVKLPATARRDAVLTKQITGLLQQIGAKAVHVVFVDADWTPLRNEASGELIGRAIGTVVGIETDEGRCFRENQTYVQDYDGNSYTIVHLNGVRDQVDMACENLK